VCDIRTLRQVRIGTDQRSNMLDRISHG
jgi:hypothetical protein